VRPTNRTNRPRAARPPRSSVLPSPASTVAAVVNDVPSSETSIRYFFA
jgi:hypothetical protein